ncbi:class I tRNA ligase family protein, partial [bacterium]|nr:class I tRNA ligase family protein [bacterium]
SDQHRGWFQSSLKMSVLINGKAPYKNLITHGFIVDEKGEKISKSKGNFVDPQVKINKYGAEILRLWVACEDYSDDNRIGDSIIESCATAYRKMRNTIRFMFGFVNDFDPETMAFKKEELTSLDRWAYLTWQERLRDIRGYYENYEFHRVYHEMLDFFTIPMSAIYLDIIKDRYTMRADDRRRRMTQSVVYSILSGVVKALAPILSFTCEEAYGYLKGAKKESVFLEQFPESDFNDEDAKFLESWQTVLDAKNAVQKKLEILRADKTIGHSLDAKVRIYYENNPVLDSELNNLESIFIVSAFEKAQSAEGLEKAEDTDLWIGVTAAEDEKCPRCWKKRKLHDYSEEITGICESCYEAIK